MVTTAALHFMFLFMKSTTRIVFFSEECDEKPAYVSPKSDYVTKGQPCSSRTSVSSSSLFLPYNTNCNHMSLQIIYVKNAPALQQL